MIKINPEITSNGRESKSEEKKMAIIRLRNVSNSMINYGQGLARIWIKCGHNIRNQCI
jgi:hypothetical protein